MARLSSEWATGSGPDVPERRLWAAVIQQAWNDVFFRGAVDVEIKPEWRGANGKLKKEFKHKLQLDAKRDRESALAWLTDARGWQARNRAMVCALAGIDADWLRDQTIIRLREQST
jgi:hypothetical protein